MCDASDLSKTANHRHLKSFWISRQKPLPIYLDRRRLATHRRGAGSSNASRLASASEGKHDLRAPAQLVGPALFYHVLIPHQGESVGPRSDRRDQRARLVARQSLWFLDGSPVTTKWLETHLVLTLAFIGPRQAEAAAVQATYAPIDSPSVLVTRVARHSSPSCSSSRGATNR